MMSRKINNFVRTIYAAKNIRSFLAHILYFKTPMPNMSEARDARETNRNTPGGFVIPLKALASTKLISVTRPIITSIYPNNKMPAFSIFTIS